MYSQRDEEPHIIRYWKDTTGRFLDVGAYDGKTFSTTRRLAELGWTGVLMEPSPSIIGALKNLYAGDDRYVILSVGLGLATEVLPFYDFGGDAVSSFNIDHAELWREKGKRAYKTLRIQTITWEELLNTVGDDFDFINLDAEGWSVHLLAAMPFERLKKLRMICVEFDHQDSQVMSIADAKGFRLLHRTAENMILVR